MSKNDAKKKRNEIRRSTHHSKLTTLQLRLGFILETKEAPTIERYKKIEKIKEEMREEWKKLRPATGQNAFSRFQQEESTRREGALGCWCVVADRWGHRARLDSWDVGETVYKEIDGMGDGMV